MKSKKLDIWL